jgi:glycosyltransferase involved in cell wall biosynthesis
LNQTFTDHEIIIVDDGSTDNTKEILAQYDNKIVYLPQSNKGISASRNRGIAAARGQYIAFLDSDDEWLPEKLAIQVDMLDKNEKLGLVCSRMLILDEDGKQRGYKPEERTGKNFKELIEIGGDLPTSTVITRKDCFDKVGVFDAALPPMEDFEMWVRIASKYDIYMLPEKVLAYYYHHDDQITKDMTLVYEATVKLDKKFINLFKHLDGFPIKIVHKRMAANEYVLSRIYYRKRRFAEAFRTLCAAIFRYPAIGTVFIRGKDTPKEKTAKFFKPYGYFIVCFFNYFRHPQCGNRWSDMRGGKE